MKGVSALLVTLSLAAASAAPARPVPQTQGTASNNDDLSQRAAERMRSLRQEADRLAGDAKTVLNSLRVLEIERQMKAEEVNALDQRAQGVAAQLTSVEEQVAHLEQEDSAQRPELERRITELYKLGQGQHWRLLLSVSDLRDLRQASRMVGMLASRDRELVTNYQDRRATLTKAREQLTLDLKTLEQLRNDEVQARQAVERAVAAQTNAMRRIDNERDLNAQLAGELQGAQQQLQSTLKSIGGTAAATSLPLRPFQGDLGWPVASRRLAQRFGASGAGRPESTGIVIASTSGTPVRAIHPGTVAFSGPFSGYGTLVIVDHGAETFSLYGYLDEATVSKGAAVQADTVVGRSGSAPAGSAIAGNIDAAGLYFELRIDGRPVDPLQWLKKN